MKELKKKDRQQPKSQKITRVRPHHRQKPQTIAHYWNTISYTAVRCSLAQRVLPDTMESRSDYPHTKVWENPPRPNILSPNKLLPIISKALERLLLKALLPMVKKSINIITSIWLQTNAFHDRTNT
jgi:hypothetical protein